MTRVIVRIDRLVLRGVAHGAQRAVAEALRAAVVQQLAQATPPAFGAGRAIAHVDAGTVRLDASATPDRMGARAGRAIAGRLGRR